MNQKLKKYCRIWLAKLTTGFKEISRFLSSIFNAIFLALVYIAGVGLTAIAAKIFKKRFLEKEINEEIKSYWVRRRPEEAKIENYLRQF